jgi:hypothetical protein
VIEIQDTETGESEYLDFGPSWFGRKTGGYSVYHGYYSPGTVPITWWEPSTAEADEKLLECWKDFEAQRARGEIWNWNP